MYGVEKTAKAGPLYKFRQGGQGRVALAHKQVAIGDQDQVLFGKTPGRIGFGIPGDQRFRFMGIMDLQDSLQLRHNLLGHNVTV